MTVTESNAPKDFPHYKELTATQFVAHAIDFLDTVRYHAAKLENCSWRDISINTKQVSILVDMVQRRQVYFHIFHGIDMGELNNGCLKCFWILKLSPFSDPKNPSRNLNLFFAISIFLDTVRYEADVRGKTLYITKDIVDHLEHAFLLRDISKEAFMAIAESLVT